MKLLHITATHLNPTGGVPVVLKNLVEEQNSIDGFIARVLSLSATINGMNSTYFDVLGDESFIEYIQRYQPDVAIIHSFFYTAYNSIVSNLVRMGIPYYIEPHGSFGKAAMKKSKLKKIIANNTIFRKQLKNAKGFIFLNIAEQKDSVYKTPNDFIIPNGIVTDNIREDIKREQQKFIYFIGRYDINHKGLDYLISALKMLDDRGKTYSIRVYGNGNDKATKYLKKSAASFKNIKLDIMGSLFGKEKDNILEQCGPMLLTSRYEGFPMTVLEAWSYGNPCIVTPGTNVWNETKKNGLGWGVNLDAQSIADGIDYAMCDYAVRREEYIENCKQYVKNNYSWNRIAMVSYEQFEIYSK